MFREREKWDKFEKKLKIKKIIKYKNLYNNKIKNGCIYYYHNLIIAISN
jgi:hypothetical protein